MRLFPALAVLVLPVLAVAGCAAGGSATVASPSAPPVQTYEGALAEADSQLDSGEFVDWYSVAGVAGETITLEMTSTSGFDPYLILSGPGEQRRDNDDATTGDLQHSFIQHVVTEAGDFRVGATSYQPGETGAYTLAVTVTEAGGTPPPAPAYEPPAGDDYGPATVYEAADVDRAPDLIGEAPRPAYPDVARAAGAEGDVTVEFVVEADGSVSDPRVTSSAGPLLNKAAIEAVELLRFVPGEVGSEAVRVRYALSVPFRLDD